MATKSVPVIPPRRKSLLFTKENSNHDKLAVQTCRHLIVTTTKGVFTWGSHGIAEIFHSGSGGIVAARRARNGSSLLAVADSQVVVLHDTRKGMQKSYKLRGSDVGPHMLNIQNSSLMTSRANFVYFDTQAIQKSFSSPPPFRMRSRVILYKNQNSSTLLITTHRPPLYLPYHPISTCCFLLPSLHPLFT